MPPLEPEYRPGFLERECPRLCRDVESATPRLFPCFICGVELPLNDPSAKVDPGDSFFCGEHIWIAPHLRAAAQLGARRASAEADLHIARLMAAEGERYRQLRQRADQWMYAFITAAAVLVVAGGFIVGLLAQ